MKKVIASFIGGIALLASVTANASLIVNGSFENNTVNAGGWKSFNSSQVDGWSSEAGIEIWNNLNNFAAFDGAQLAELNSNGSGYQSLYQSFASDAGQVYALDFAHTARDNLSESFKIVISDANSDTTLFSEVITQTTRRQWNTFNTVFVASSDMTTITFTSLNSGSTGNLLDAVSVTVPEPGSLGLMVLGLIALVCGRARKA
ncbi:DUF642 domain-containing protein [Salinimonas sp. HHU 13199]|uniref:DUF642 domain-containing protein n=1 Tax=Salinimonas profundi TaxID=2729140 RepID=A0ABR8LM75_9ALTE|nr:DUF642 domain-containing protein [Salinimonas profundi]MBD3585024.1 DUF642 domain-containing protein [Salinimonas profundi]